MLSVNIQKRLGNFRLRVNFEAESGVTGILGASGCGKSMTLRCIAGIEKPDAGKIVLNGVTLFDSEKHINLPPQKRGVGYLFQNYALFPNMSAKKNILCGLYHEKDAAKKQEQLQTVLRFLQLEELADHRPAQLSGGQQQRVALGRILVSRPGILMLDEPFSALDSHLRDDLHIHLKRLLEQYDGAVLMVTHSRDEAYRLCDRIALMDSGAFLALKPTGELFADPGTIAGASITGCKNIVAARKTGEYEVDVPDWGIRLATDRPVADDLCAVGIRAHDFGAETARNRYPIYQTDEMEEPFERIIRFRYRGQSENTPDIWWRLSKDRQAQETPPELGVSPSHVLPLYPGAQCDDKEVNCDG